MEAQRKNEKAESRATKRKSNAKFGIKFVWDMLEKQNEKCALTGRILDKYNIEVELVEPYKNKDRDSADNHYLLDKSVSFLARHYNEKEIIKLAIEIVKYRGKELGYKLVKESK